MHHRFCPDAAVIAFAFLTLTACGGRDTVAPSAPQAQTASAGAGAGTTGSADGATNLLQNASFDIARMRTVTPGWSRMTFGTPSPTFSYPVSGRSGNGASVSFAANSTGDARWQPTAVAVTAGAVYSYSVWYKSTAPSTVTIEYANDSDVRSYVGLAELPSSNGIWMQYSTAFTVPAAQRKASVYNLLRLAGTLTIDDAVLVQGQFQRPAAPTITFNTSASSITAGDIATLSWTTTNVSSCTASGAWAGTRTASGLDYVAPTTNSVFTLTCVGPGGSVSRTITIVVSAVTPPPGGFAEGMVTFSFDDSWEAAYVNALPMLEAAGFKATFYLTTNFIEQGFALFLTPARTQDIARRGHEIAGHTNSHPDLTTLSVAAARTELEASRAYLYYLTGAPVNSFAYPFGSVNAMVKQLVRESGYTSARGVRGAQLNVPTSDPFDLYSDCLGTSTTLAEVRARVDAAKANKQWYILCLHDVLPFGGDNLTLTPQRFGEIVSYIRSTGIRVVTAEQGRSLMTN